MKTKPIGLLFLSKVWVFLFSVRKRKIFFGLPAKWKVN